MLNEQIRFVHQAERPFLPLSLVIELGGLTLGLLIFGHVITRLAQAKTLFLVKFTEDVFRHSSNNAANKTDFATGMASAYAQNGEASVRPLRGKSSKQNPKTLLQTKIVTMCSAIK